MFYPPEVVEEIRTSNDIVDVISSYITLKQKGSYYFGSCPFHNEGTPSFSVHPDRQLYHCFGCGASGNVISFIMAIENFDFLEAVKHLADRINYTLPEGHESQKMKEQRKLKETLYEIHVVVARYYYENLISEKGKPAEAYLDDRQILPNIRRKFGLGYSPKQVSLYDYLIKKGYSTEILLKTGIILESKRKKGFYYDRFFGRLMFPIFDVNGKVIAFGGRIIDSENTAKYLNSSDSLIFNKSKNLYGLNFARKSMAKMSSKEVILVEGYMDVLALNQAGFSNAIASLGTAFNEEHAKLLRKYADSVVLVFDSDNAGTEAILRAIPILFKQGLKIKVLRLKGAKDPDEYLLKFGKQKLADEISKSDDHINFQVKLLKEKYDLDIASEKVDFIKEVSKILSDLNDNILIDCYTDEVSKLTNISSESIKTHINGLFSDSVKSVNKTVKNNYIYKKSSKLSEKGIIEAQKGVIFIIAEDKSIYLKVKDILSPDELSEETYIKLLSLIYKNFEENNEIFPADLVNFFEDREEQRKVSDIFNSVISFANKHDTEKALNDHIRLVKETNIEKQIAELEGKRGNELDDNVFSEEYLKLVNQREKLKSFYINLG